MIDDLAALAKAIDTMLDQVHIDTPDDDLRRNRLALLALARGTLRHGIEAWFRMMAQGSRKGGCRP